MRIAILLVCVASVIKAQQTYFSAPNQQLLALNPAFAGSNSKLRIQAAGGVTEFPRYGHSTESYFGGIDTKIGKRHGLGLSVRSLSYGQYLQQKQADLSYAISFSPCEKIKIVPAVQLSIFHLQLDRKYQNFGEEYRQGAFIPVWGWEGYPRISTKSNLDFSAGILTYGKNFFVGASFLSFTQPDEGLRGVSKRPLTQIYQGAYRVNVCDHFNVDAYAIGKLQRMREQFVQYGINPNWKYFSLNIAHRLNEKSNYDAFIAGAALKFHGFKIGYNSTCNYSRYLDNYFFNEVFISVNFNGCCKKKDATVEGGVEPLKLFY